MVGNYKCNQKSRILYWRADIVSKMCNPDMTTEQIETKENYY